MTESPFPAHTDVPAQEDGGATILEIGQQPDAWREVAGRADAQAAGFLREIAGRPDLRVILDRGGQFGVRGGDRGAGPAASSRPPRRGHRDDEHRGQSPRLPGAPHPTLVVSFGRSGNSPESLATTALADELVDDVWHLIFTCDRDGELGRAHSGRANSLVVYMPERTNDSGFAMTSSLTSMLLSCLMMLGPGRTRRRRGARPRRRARRRSAARHPGPRADQEAAIRLPRQRPIGGARAGIGTETAGTDGR